MRPPEEDVLLRDMLDHARRAVDAVAERDRSDLDSDLILAAALERFIEVIGEAASKVSPSTKANSPEMTLLELSLFLAHSPCKPLDMKQPEVVAPELLLNPLGFRALDAGRD